MSTKPSARPSIAVLVPVLNESASIAGCLHSLQAQSYEGSMRFVFIDGGSTDDTVEQLQAASRFDPRIVILDNPQRITPVALNIGLHASSADYIIRFDAHSTFPDTYVSKAVDRILRNDVSSVSGPAIATGTSAWARRVALALSTKLGTGDAAFRSMPVAEIEVDTGFCGIWARSLLVAHGGWDEATYPNEDAELAARIRKCGGRIVCLPELAAAYEPRNGIRPLAAQYWRYGQFRTRTAVRHPGSLRRSHVLAPGLALTTVIALTPIPLVSAAARLGLGLYGSVVVTSSVTKINKHGWKDALSLPVIYTTMHLAWGFGFLRGMTRFGIPAKALVAAVTGRSKAENATPLNERISA